MKKHFSSYWIRSAFYTFLQRFSLTLFGLLSLMILIRTLNKSEMGVWMLFLVVTSIFETTKTGLIKNAHIRFVSALDNNPDKSAIAASSLIINALITVGFILFILFFSGWLSQWLKTDFELSRMLTWFIPGLAGMIFFSHLEAVQQSHFDFKGVFAGHFVRQLLFFSVICYHYLLHIPITLEKLAFYQGLTIIAGTGVLYLFSKKYLLHRFDPSMAWTRKILGYGGYIFSSGIISNIVANIDQVMIAKFLGNISSVAYYGTASRINLLADIPSYAAADVLFPKAARASVSEGKEKVRYLYERMVAVLLCFTVPASLFIILFPKLVIGIIAGPGFYAAAPILQLYMFTGLMRPMQNQAANLMNSIGKPALCFYMNTLALLANLGINYVCLVNFGFYGAAIGTLITLTLISIAWYFIMRKQIGATLEGILGNMKRTYTDIYTFIHRILLKRKLNA